MARNEVNDLTLGRRLDFVDDKYDSPGCYCSAPLGGVRVTGRKGGMFSIVVGPDAGFILITLLLIITPSVFLILHDWGESISYAFTVSTILTVISYLTVALSDPGILLKSPPPSDDERGEAAAAAGAYGPDLPVEEIITSESKTGETHMVYSEEARCGICDIPRPEGTLHCPRCCVCIRGFDHHCPWVGKCVGEDNLRAFWAMLTIICLHALFATFVVVQILSKKTW